MRVELYVEKLMLSVPGGRRGRGARTRAHGQAGTGRERRTGRRARQPRARTLRRRAKTPSGRTADAYPRDITRRQTSRTTGGNRAPPRPRPRPAPARRSPRG